MFPFLLVEHVKHHDHMNYLYKKSVIELEHIAEINNCIASSFLQELKENLQVNDYIKSIKGMQVHACEHKNSKYLCETSLN